MTAAGLRRTIHGSTALLAGAALVGHLEAVRWFLTLAVPVGVVFETARIRWPRLREAVARAVPVYRERERERPSGALWLAAGLATTAWFPFPAAGVGLWAAALADPAASWIGGRWGRPRGDKSWPGTAACLVVAFGGAVVFGTGLPVAFGAGIAAAVAERWAPVDDNLLVGPAAALAAVLL